MKSLTLRVTPAEERAAVVRLCRQWEVPTEPRCSNCLHATVHGTPEHPVVSCYHGHGKAEMDLWRMIRPYRPVGFRSAVTCPDFSSMSDDEARP